VEKEEKIESKKRNKKHFAFLIVAYYNEMRSRKAKWNDS